MRKLLKERFEIEKVPCYYWFLTLMNLIKPESLNKCFRTKSGRGKSNETSAAWELLEELNISGCVIVADALNCQKKTAETIISKEADYILCVKDNQPNLKKDIEEYTGEQKLLEGMNAASEREAQSAFPRGLLPR